MSKGATIRVRLLLGRTPDDVTVIVRFGNHWKKANIRIAGGLTCESLFRVSTDHAFLVEKMHEAEGRGEMWTKDGAGSPWVKSSRKGGAK